MALCSGQHHGKTNSSIGHGNIPRRYARTRFVVLRFPPRATIPSTEADAGSMKWIRSEIIGHISKTFGLRGFWSWVFVLGLGPWVLGLWELQSLDQRPK